MCLFHFIPTRLWRWNRHSVPKRWHFNYRRRWITHTYTPMKMEQTQCSETLAFKLQTTVNHPETKHTKSRTGRMFEVKRVLEFDASPTDAAWHTRNRHSSITPEWKNSEPVLERLFSSPDEAELRSLVLRCLTGKNIAVLCNVPQLSWS
jgi:hypothetical protein